MTTSRRLLATLTLLSSLLVAGCDSGPNCKAPRPTNCGGLCVDMTSDAQNCGACAKSCKQGEACVAGACATSCPVGQTACAGACVTTASDFANCGGCGKSCKVGEVCSMSTCAVACGASLKACSGACVNTQTDPGNCGDCAIACKQGELCSAGKCALSCPSSQMVCNRSCVDTTSDAANCGGCAMACKQGESCVASKCVTACPSSETACNGKCVDLTSDAQNCSACGMACQMGELCVSGKCALSCPSAQTACNGKCVDLTSDAQNCSACGMACADGQSCQSSACASICANGRSYCGNNVCANLMTDNANCGVCGKACANGAVCSMGQCLAGCQLPLIPCNNLMSCVDPRNDPDNCNGCGNVCPSLANAGRACAGSKCGIGACAAGFANCDANDGNGCEINTTNDKNNCGACAKVCGPYANGVASCGAGKCIENCNQGFLDCNQNTADGCEANSNTDVNNCGKCGVVCQNGTTCAAGACCSVIAGPSLNNNIIGWPMSGLQIRALRTATLHSVDFNNQGQADTVRFIDATANQTIAVVATPAGNPVIRITGDWPLVAGHVYHLTSDLSSNGRWTTYSSFPTQNSQISVDSTWGNGAAQSSFWFTFTNLNGCG